MTSSVELQGRELWRLNESSLSVVSAVLSYAITAFPHWWSLLPAACGGATSVDELGSATEDGMQLTVEQSDNAWIFVEAWICRLSLACVEDWELPGLWGMRGVKQESRNIIRRSKS